MAQAAFEIMDFANEAYRMKSVSEPGKISILVKTYLLIKDYFDCSYSWELEVKTIGKMKINFVDGTKAINYPMA